MTSATRDAILEAIAGRLPNQAGWIRANCPFCEWRHTSEDRSVSLGVHVSGWYVCWRCNFRGRLREPLEDIEYTAPEKVERNGPVIFDPPEGYTPLWKGQGKSAFVFGAARGYLHRRGIDDELIEQCQIGACLVGDFGGRVIVPVLSAEGDWLWYVGRAWNKSIIRRYHYPQGEREGVMFNQSALLRETSEPAYVVEGVFDAIPHWPDAVACLGKPNGTQVNAISGARRPVVIALDGDAWEEAWAVSYRVRLAGLKQCAAIRLPPKTDPGDTDFDVLEAMGRAALAEVADG